MQTNSHDCTNQNENPTRLSYKFQRLRERIRRSILAGEFSGRMPGERALAERYCANAKTINKALCDLAAEGLVVRHIGRGTYVAELGQDGKPAESTGKPSRKFSSLAPALAERRERFDAELAEALSENGDELRLLRTSNGVAGLTLGDWPADTRSDTDGLFLPVPAALSDAGRMDDELVLHASRRQVPLVSIGACAASSKLNAVAPDFVDGGFRLAEHLFRLDCTTVTTVATAATRETIATINGAKTAAARFGGAIVEIKARGSELRTALLQGDEIRKEGAIGIMLIGSTAIRAFLGDAELMAAWQKGGLAVCGIPDLGDESANEAGMTAYESDPGTVCRWAARLMDDTRPGRRPVEFLIPGQMRIRNTVGSAAGAAAMRNQSRDQGQTLPKVAI